MTHASIRIKNQIGEIATVAAAVEAFGTSNELPGTIIKDLNVALDEVLNNIISYAYTDGSEHVISVELSCDGAAMTAVVTDDGVIFNPLQAPLPVLEPDLATRRVGGLGIHFVRNLMDQCRYDRIEEKNVLILTKYIG